MLKDAVIPTTQATVSATSRCRRTRPQRTLRLAREFAHHQDRGGHGMPMNSFLPDDEAPHGRPEFRFPPSELRRSDSTTCARAGRETQNRTAITTAAYIARRQEVNGLEMHLAAQGDRPSRRARRVRGLAHQHHRNKRAMKNSRACGHATSIDVTRRFQPVPYGRCLTQAFAGFGDGSQATARC